MSRTRKKLIKDAESVWFTSDPHYYHKNIIAYCNRPALDVEEMNELLISNHNARVKPTDTVYFLGDIGFCSITKLKEIVSRLNGNKIHLLGNHDPDGPIEGFMETRIFDVVQFNDVNVVLMHYPIEEWPGKERGYIHLHGHCHGSGRQVKNRLDVGVDVQGMAPISLAEVLRKIESINASIDRQEEIKLLQEKEVEVLKEIAEYCKINSSHIRSILLDGMINRLSRIRTSLTMVEKKWL
jgi:calcineurin-like phosphoesterase family protein